MTVPFGTTAKTLVTVVPSVLFARAQPSEPSLVETMSGVGAGLYSSTNSSRAPAGPRMRNSLMIKEPEVAGAAAAGLTCVHQVSQSPA